MSFTNGLDNVLNGRKNESLNPHNPDAADAEIAEVISWRDFVSLIYQITEGKIEIVEELEE